MNSKTCKANVKVKALQKQRIDAWWAYCDDLAQLGNNQQYGGVGRLPSLLTGVFPLPRVLKRQDISRSNPAPLPPALSVPFHGDYQHGCEERSVSNITPGGPSSPVQRPRSASTKCINMEHQWATKWATKSPTVPKAGG